MRSLTPSGNWASASAGSGGASPATPHITSASQSRTVTLGSYARPRVARATRARLANATAETPLARHVAWIGAA
jgi:hypothetical protein